jgi:uncharacterized membrane-anchored protein YhcB (DUF1043 family)
MTLAGVAWIALWILVAVGAVLGLIAPILILRPLRRVTSRPESLARAQLLIDLEQLQERNDELARIPARVAPLIERTLRARRSLEVSLRMLKLPQALAALRTAGLAVRMLVKALHGS